MTEQWDDMSTDEKLDLLRTDITRLHTAISNIVNFAHGVASDLRKLQNAQGEQKEAD